MGAHFEAFQRKEEENGEDHATETVAPRHVCDRLAFMHNFLINGHSANTKPKVDASRADSNMEKHPPGKKAGGREKGPPDHRQAGEEAKRRAKRKE